MKRRRTIFGFLWFAMLPPLTYFINVNKNMCWKAWEWSFGLTWNDLQWKFSRLLKKDGCFLFFLFRPFCLFLFLGQLFFFLFRPVVFSFCFGQFFSSFGFKSGLGRQLVPNPWPCLATHASQYWISKPGADAKTISSLLFKKIPLLWHIQQTTTCLWKCTRQKTK